MLNRWAPWYEVEGPNAVGRNYGPTTTYTIAEDFLRGVDIEDWGCGFGYFRTVHTGGYVGVDGTPGYCDVVADLTEYRSTTPGILLRGVLDHNAEWRKILANALASFTEVLVVILFTPPGEDNAIGYVAELDVHDYALPHEEITVMVHQAGCTYDLSFYSTRSGYDGETVWVVRR